MGNPRSDDNVTPGDALTDMATRARDDTPAYRAANMERGAAHPDPDGAHAAHDERPRYGQYGLVQEDVPPSTIAGTGDKGAANPSRSPDGTQTP